MVLLYPLRPSPLILMISVSFLIWLGFVSLMAFLLFAFFFGVIAPLFIKFLFVILDHRANGLDGAPNLRAQTLQPFGEWRPYQLFFVLGTLYLLINFLFSNEYIMLGKMVLLYSLIALPAIIALMTMSHSIRIALNPLSQLKFIKIAGFQYWVMLACVALGGLLINYLIETNTTEFLIVFSILYTATVTFNWLGVIIYNRRVAFDHVAINSPEIEEEEREEALQHSRTMCLYRASREYPSENALAIILKYIENEETDFLVAHQWFADELSLLENKGFAKRHSKAHIEALYSAGKTAMADLLKESNANNYQ